MSIKTACEANGIKVNDRRKVSMGGATKRSKSRVTHIARHHSGVNVDQSMSILEGFWKNTHGWSTGGYHVVIHFDGSVDWNYDYDVTSNGVGGHNSYIFNISVLGNGKFTVAQEKSWTVVAKEAQRELGIPTKNVWGHKEFSGHSTNSCPGINMNTVRTALNAGRPAGATNPVASKPVPAPVADGKLRVDGWWGESTTRALQKYFGTPVDGIISQPSMMVKELQKLIGAKVDGYFGEDSIRALQKFFGTPVDGILSEPSLVVKELQTRLNAGNLGKAKPVETTKPATPKPVAKPSVTTETQSIAGVQTFLNRWFNGGLKVDNLMGASTKKALIKALQTELNKQFKAGLTVDGIWGARTKNACVNVKKGASGNLTRLIQAALICKGYDVKGFDGKFGDGLDKAVRSFQTKTKQTLDGIAGKGTFEALFK